MFELHRSPASTCRDAHLLTPQSGPGRCRLAPGRGELSTDPLAASVLAGTLRLALFQGELSGDLSVEQGVASTLRLALSRGEVGPFPRSRRRRAGPRPLAPPTSRSAATG